jgi:hypothetical protein
MESRATVRFTFAHTTLDGALRQLLDALDGQHVNGYRVVDVTVHLVTVYWQVMAYCLAERDDN